MVGLNVACLDRKFGHVLREAKGAGVARTVCGRHSVADSTHSNLLGGDSNHLFWNDIRGHDVEGAEEILVVSHVGFPDVIGQDLLLLWVLLKVFLQSFVANELLLELKHFLLHN